MKATRFVIIGFAAAIIADTAAAAEEDQVAIDVYEGPMECDEADRVKVGDRLGMHYTGTIDGSSRTCLLYTSPSPRDRQKSRMPSSA